MVCVLISSRLRLVAFAMAAIPCGHGNLKRARYRRRPGAKWVGRKETGIGHMSADGVFLRKYTMPMWFVVPLASQDIQSLRSGQMKFCSPLATEPASHYFHNESE
jgi:hypothetical protein